MKVQSYLVAGLTAVMGLCGVLFIATVPFPGRGIVAGLVFAGMVYAMAWFIGERVEIKIKTPEHGKLV